MWFFKSPASVKNLQRFMANYHMDYVTFSEIFELLKPHLLPKRDTRPDAIKPIQKFAMVIDYLASGSISRHMESIYRISKQHMDTIIDAVCEALAAVLNSEVPVMTAEGLAIVTKDNQERWQFLSCAAAIDGKHVTRKAPPNAGSLFYNYKGFHSIVLFAVADAKYYFTYLYIAAYGSEGDAYIFAASSMGKG